MSTWGSRPGQLPLLQLFSSIIHTSLSYLMLYLEMQGSLHKGAGTFVTIHRNYFLVAFNISCQLIPHDLLPC
jgi:hypothetical protein